MLIKEIDISIGSLSIYKIEDNNYNDFGIINLKGIVNTVDGKKTLVGIVMEIDNNKNSKITINDIQLYDLNAYISGVYEIEEDINSNTNIETIIKKEYKLKDTKVNVTKEIYENARLLLTIGYFNHYQISKLGFKINYQIDGLNREFVFTDFTFFNDHLRYIPINELTFYTYGYN